MKRVAFVLAALAVVTPARADPTLPLAGDAAYLDAGFDGAVAARVGWAHRVDALDGGVLVDATLVAGGTWLDDGRYRAGIRTDALHAGVFAAPVLVLPELVTASTPGFTAIAVGTDMALMPGIYTHRWAAAVEAGYDRAWLTHVTPTDWYRTYVYAGAREGWYAGTGAIPRLGVRGAVLAGPVEITARGGLAWTGSFDVLPGVYATLGAGWRF